MKIVIGLDGGFKGEQPRLAPRLLPNGNAQVAVMAKVIRGSLEAWRENTSQGLLPKAEAEAEAP